MTADEFENRIAALEEHLVSESAEEALKRAEQTFAEEGNTAGARLDLMTAKSKYRREQRENERREAQLLDEWEDEDA